MNEREQTPPGSLDPDLMGAAAYADPPQDGVLYLDAPSDLDIAEGLKSARRREASVGGVHIGAAAFGTLVVTTAFGWAKFLWGFDVPPEVLVPTGTIAGVVSGWVYPSD